MTQMQLLNGFRQLSLPEQLEMIQAALRIVASHVQTIEHSSNGSEQNERLDLAQAANALLADYLEDKELTSFSALDGESFYAQG